MGCFFINSKLYVCLSLVWFYEAALGARECTSGFYGTDCTKRCPPSCKTGVCSRSGLCAECIPGLYGIRCNNPCPTTCIQTECYRYNVTCTQGCKTGWYGHKCEKPCTNCVGGCHRHTGRCSSLMTSRRSQSRKEPPRCGQDSRLHDRCVAGCRGGNCDTSCPDICLQCDRYGENCTSCVAGKYGEQCDKTCPKSCHLTCDMYGECASTYTVYVQGMEVAKDGADSSITVYSVSDDTDHKKNMITLAAVVGGLLLSVAIASSICGYVLRSQRTDGTKISNSSHSAMLIPNNPTLKVFPSPDIVKPKGYKETNSTPDSEKLLPLCKTIV